MSRWHSKTVGTNEIIPRVRPLPVTREKKSRSEGANFELKLAGNVNRD